MGETPSIRERVPIREQVAAPKSHLTEQFGVRGVPEWLAWVARFAVMHDVGRQELIAVALERLAKDVGYVPPPPRLAIAPKSTVQRWARENTPGVAAEPAGPPPPS